MKKWMAFLLLLVMAASLSFAAGRAAAPSGPRTITWWDHFLPLAPMHQEIWDQYAARTGNRVEYTQYDPARQSDALLLAFRANQCPDVFSNTLSAQPAALFKEGWFSPMALTKEDLPLHVRETLFEGATMFEGKVYSFPLMSTISN